jgi:ribosome assembly protein YihI (activator of Der GTPase)
LHEYELIEIIVTENKNYLKEAQIDRIEKMIRLHYDLEINLEGIHVIDNLLDRLENLQSQITTLNNRLKFYEDF